MFRGEVDSDWVSWAEITSILSFKPLTAVPPEPAGKCQQLIFLFSYCLNLSEQAKEKITIPIFISGYPWVWCCGASCDWKRTLQAFLLRVAGRTRLRRFWHSFLCPLATPDMADSYHCFIQERSTLHSKHLLSLPPTLPMLCSCSSYTQGRFCNFLALSATTRLLTPSSMHLYQRTTSVLVTKTGHHSVFSEHEVGSHTLKVYHPPKWDCHI